MSIRAGVCRVILLALLATFTTLAVFSGESASPREIQQEDLAPRIEPTKPTHTTIPPGYSRERLHVKFREGAMIRLQGEKFSSERSDELAGVEAVLSNYPGIRIERLFSRPEEELKAERTRIERKSKRQQADANLYYRLTPKRGTNAEALLDQLNALDIVEIAYPEPEPQPPPGSVTPPFTSLEGYLKPAPQGIDAEFAGVPGIGGEGVRIIDIEYSWNDNHEDLSKARGRLIPNGNPWDPFGDCSVVDTCFDPAEQTPVTLPPQNVGSSPVPERIAGSTRFASGVILPEMVALPWGTALSAGAAGW